MYYLNQLLSLAYYNNQRIMQKSRKDKGKKNAQTIPIVATQNTNLFSQLSAQYLQSKSIVSEQEKKFIDNTQVIEYHDPQINRILQRLRKKDQTTKIKAILQLKEQIFKMQEEDISNFSTTFCYLFRSLVLNEESKKVQMELQAILQHILKNFKKLVLPNIAILFPALLIFQKVNKCSFFNLLFTGDQSTYLDKALILIEKAQVTKQFIILAKIIIDKHDKDKLGQSLLLNNCTGLIKSFKQLILLKGQKQKHQNWSDQWNNLFNEIKNILVSGGAKQFLKQNTKAKAAILQIYMIYVEIAAKNNKQLDETQQFMLKQNRINFLQKQQIIQNSQWKHSNIKLLQVLFALDRMKEVEEIENKFLSVIEIGGQQMFKQLKNFIKLLPSFKFDTTDSTKFLNTLTLIKKTNQTLLSLQQFNEQRLNCYEDINTYFLSLYHKLKPELEQIKVEEKEQKRWQECKKALNKAERSIVENLEQLYYKYPPASKNSFTYYIPPVFCSLIKQIQILPRSNINIPFTYHLYKQIASEQKLQPLVNQIFNSRKSLDQLLQYFQNFPSRPIQIDMTGDNLLQIYKKCRIYQLTIQHQKPNWFNWSNHFNFFMFDPMLEVKHISLIDANQTIQFNKKLNIEKMDKYIPEKLKFMEKLLEQSSPQAKYYIPSYLRYVNKSQQFDINSLIKISNEYRLKLAVPNTYIIKTVQHIYSIIIEYLKTNKNKNNAQSIQLDLFGFVLYLYDFNMEADAYSLLQKSLELRDTVYFNNILDGVISHISKRIQVYVDSGEIIQQKKQRILKKKVDKFIVLLNKTLELLIRINYKLDQFAQHFLRQQYFKYGLYRPEIWILFHSIASHLKSNEIQLLIKQLIQKQNNYVLGLLICVNNIYPLQTNLELKKFYQTIYTTEISPRIIDLFENGDQKGYNLVTKMLELSNKSLIFTVGIKNLIKQSIIEDIPIGNIERLFEITIGYLFNSLQKGQNLMRKSIAIQTILPEFVSLLSKNINIFQQSLEKVTNIAKQKAYQKKIEFEVYLDVITIFWQQKINTNLIFQIDIESLVNYLFTSINKQSINTNFELQVLLNFMNVIIQNKTLEPFSEYLLDIQKYINVLIQHNKQKSPEFMNNALVKLCEFLRKILSIIEAFSPEFKDGLFEKILNLCISKVKQFEKVAEDIDAGVVDENIDTIILELSELINRFTLVPSIKGNEQEILSLLNTKFASLQKSAFIYLRYSYQALNNNNKDSALYLMKKVLNNQVTDDISTIFSQTLLWILLFIKKMNLNSNNEDLEQFLLIYQRQKCSSEYLNFVFKTIDHLGYDQTEEQFYCDVNEVIEVSLNWSNYMSQRELFKLLIQSLFIFSSNFPMDLRLWYDEQKDKKQQALCQKILKNIISDALFSKEIEKIQLRQLEWKTQQFDVYALPKSKQICAEYANNGAKISLKLKINNNYPLSPITIQFANELKIEQKLKKWILKLKSLLYNQNNSICSGIILWKQNIDKEFEGLDQCAICYDIVNSQKQLPNMVCKTCKKKFHSACIRKWFQTSNKSQCPLCKSQFL